MENNIVQMRDFLATKLGIGKGQISQAVLQNDKALSTQNSVPFAITQQGNSAPLNTDVLLTTSDSFVITHLRLRIYQIASDTPTDAQRAIAKLYNYVNPAVFAQANDANLQALFNGQFSLTVDNVRWIPQMPTTWFERVPQSQQGVTTTAYIDSNGDDALTVIPRDEIDNSLYGAVATLPIVINGNQNVSPLITLPANVNVDTADFLNYARLECFGFLMVNTIVDRYIF